MHSGAAGRNRALSVALESDKAQSGSKSDHVTAWENHFTFLNLSVPMVKWR